MDRIQFPQIEVKFGTVEELNEQILSVYVKTMADAINAARGNVVALKSIRDFAKEVVWVTDSLIYETINPRENTEKKI